MGNVASERRAMNSHPRSHRERILAAIAGEPMSCPPLSFFHFKSLRLRCRSEEDYITRQLSLGTDPIVSLPSLPVTLPNDVNVLVDEVSGGRVPLLRKQYVTRRGTLTTTVVPSPGWPHGADIPLFSDFSMPRARKFLITSEADIPALECLLQPPTPKEISAFREASRQVQQFADLHRLAVKAGYTRLPETLCLLCGFERFAVMGIDSPTFFEQLISVVVRWLRARMDVYLSAAPDIFVKGEWYGTPFLSPTLYERYFLKVLRDDVATIHAAGTRVCYIATSNVMPFLRMLRDAGIDLLFGVDPIQGRWDLAETLKVCRGRVCVCGGINGYLSLVNGSEADVTTAIDEALSMLASNGGVILSPVDDVRIDSEDCSNEIWARIWHNVTHLARLWRAIDGQLGR